jgi:hypothetical protein
MVQFFVQVATSSLCVFRSCLPLGGDRVDLIDLLVDRPIKIFKKKFKKFKKMA